MVPYTMSNHGSSPAASNPVITASLENGKKVKYKFDCSPAEKAIERLSK